MKSESEKQQSPAHGDAGAQPDEDSRPPAYLGIDLGGSNINACAFDAAGETLVEDKVDTDAKNGYEHVIARIGAQLQRIERGLREREYRLAAAGLCVPGVVVSGEGRVQIAPNLGLAQRTSAARSQTRRIARRINQRRERRSGGRAVALFRKRNARRTPWRIFAVPA